MPPVRPHLSGACHFSPCQQGSIGRRRATPGVGLRTRQSIRRASGTRASVDFSSRRVVDHLHGILSRGEDHLANRPRPGQRIEPTVLQRSFTGSFLRMLSGWGTHSWGLSSVPKPEHRTLPASYRKRSRPRHPGHSAFLLLRCTQAREVRYSQAGVFHEYSGRCETQLQ